MVAACGVEKEMDLATEGNTSWCYIRFNATRKRLLRPHFVVVSESATQQVQLRDSSEATVVLAVHWQLHLRYVSRDLDQLLFADWTWWTSKTWTERL